jgi:hypothetical protein
MPMCEDSSVAALAVILGILVPVGGGIAVARLAGGPVAAVAVVCFSAALNAIWPLGGGMVVDGASRVRFGISERTFDSHRNSREAFIGTLLLAAVTVGGFFAYVPIVTVAWRALEPIRPPYGEALALVAVLSAVVVGVARNPRELPLYRWRREAEAASPTPHVDEWRERVRRMARIARPDGSIGHVGGIGARTAGLHEVLDAERVLRKCAEMGIEEAARLREGCLSYLRSQGSSANGFPVYPGGLPRPETTQRALEALSAQPKLKSDI